MDAQNESKGSPIKQKGMEPCDPDSIEQLRQLEEFYENFPNPDARQQKQLSKIVGLEPDQIELWFETRRAKTKEAKFLATVSKFLQRSGTNAELFATSIEEPRNPLEEKSVQKIGGHFLYHIEENEKNKMIQAADEALQEAEMLLQMNEPLWIRSSNEEYVLNGRYYHFNFPKKKDIPHTPNAVIETSKYSEIVPLSVFHLVDIFSDPKCWMECFLTIVTDAKTISKFDSNAFVRPLHLMSAKLHVISPLVAPRDLTFLRCTRQIDENTWLIADVSYDCFGGLKDASSSSAECWKFPSGCLLQDLSNGTTRVTWVEHVQVMDKLVNISFYNNTAYDVQAYGARKWIATLLRSCERFMSATKPIPDHVTLGAIKDVDARWRLMQFSQRMIKNFCKTFSKSNKILDLPQHLEYKSREVQFLIRKYSSLRQPFGLSVFGATTLWLPISYKKLFNYFSSEYSRVQWDVLADGNTSPPVVEISTGSSPKNVVAIMMPSFTSDKEMLILQETYMDDTGAMLVYAPTCFDTLCDVMTGKPNASRKRIVSSGFAMSPDIPTPNYDTGAEASNSMKKNTGGAYLTMAFQIEEERDKLGEGVTKETIEVVRSFIKYTERKLLKIANDLHK